MLLTEPWSEASDESPMVGTLTSRRSTVQRLGGTGTTWACPGRSIPRSRQPSSATELRLRRSRIADRSRRRFTGLRRLRERAIRLLRRHRRLVVLPVGLLARPPVGLRRDRDARTEFRLRAPRRIHELACGRARAGVALIRDVIGIRVARQRVDRRLAVGELRLALRELLVQCRPGREEPRRELVLPGHAAERAHEEG